MAEIRVNRYDTCIRRIGYQEYYRILSFLRGGFGEIYYRQYYGYRRFEDHRPNPDDFTEDWDDFNKLLLRLIPNVQNQTMIPTNEDGTANYAYQLFNARIPEIFLNDAHARELFQIVFIHENGAWRTRKRIRGNALSRLYHYMQSLGGRYLEYAIVLRLFAFIRYQNNTRRHRRRQRDGHAQEVANLLINLFDRLPSVRARREAREVAQREARREQQREARDIRAATREARRAEADQLATDEMLQDIFRED